jgi:transposase-like protein
MKPPITAQQAACLSLLLYGETGNAVARILGVTPGTISHWRKKLEALGLIGPPEQVAGGRPRKSAAEAEEGAEDDALSYLPPEARHWLRQGWGEFAERERAAQAAGTDYFSRTRPDRKQAKKRPKKPIDRIDSDAGTE